MAKGKTKKKTIAFDLDGVVIDRPPFVPKALLEILYRGLSDKELRYRRPESRFEITVRKVSHLPYFRPPIAENVAFIGDLKKRKEFKLIAISSRYSFLENRTNRWFEFYGLKDLFEKIHLNIEDEQPHKFKYKKLHKLKPFVFVDDDEKLINYLKGKKLKTKFYYFEKGDKNLKDLLKL